jgi:acyl carrier protein
MTVDHGTRSIRSRNEEIHMADAWTRDKIISFIKQDLLLERLDLAGAGKTLEDIHDDTALIHKGLGLDSVDALDLLVEVEKVFGLKLPDLSGPFIAKICENVGHLADYILAARAQTISTMAPQPAATP